MIDWERGCQTQLILGCSLSRLISISKNYGTEAGSGGYLTYKTASIDVTTNSQVYNISDFNFEVAGDANKTIEINIPFYVSYNDCQIVFRIYYYPYSSNGKELTDDELQEIEQNLNGKPMGIRINDIELTLSQGLLSFSNLVSEATECL